MGNHDEPCSHPGCLHHVTHPCEGCGRVAGHRLQQIKGVIEEAFLCEDVQGKGVDTYPFEVLGTEIKRLEEIKRKQEDEK